jgi:glycolate oxidase FAD binding subunit
MNTILRASLCPTSVSDVQQAVVEHAKVLAVGGQTKPGLAAGGDRADVVALDLRGLTGILEYEPGEYTFTAYAGTPLTEICAALAEHGQYLPFDPPWVEAGATLGGTIAAGLSGSRRYRFGGLRDFILGVQMVDGQGRLVRGGGKVVKNAAGFDLPKLMVGSLGRLGIVVSASFKVFPAPPRTATLALALPDLNAGLVALAHCMGGTYDLEALDLVATPTGFELRIRVGGPDDVLEARLARLQARLDPAAGYVSVTHLDDQAMWREQQELAWAAPEHALVKVATTPHTLPALDAHLAQAGALRRYCVGGNLAWISWPGALHLLDQGLAALGCTGLVLRGDSAGPLIGATQSTAFLTRVQRALDPTQRFLDFA